MGYNVGKAPGMPERRYRIIYASNDVLLGILNNRLTVHDFDLPDDARVVGVDRDFQRDAIAIIVQSAEFDPVPLGDTIPTLYPYGFKLSHKGSRQ